METPEKFDEWALLELMGHQQIVGRVSESPLFGASMIRVDVPSINGSQAYTRFYNPAAVYSLNPVTEEVARGLLTQSRFRNEPVSRFDVPQIADKSDGNPGQVAENADYCSDCRELAQHCTCA